MDKLDLLSPLCDEVRLGDEGAVHSQPAVVEREGGILRGAERLGEAYWSFTRGQGPQRKPQS